MMTQTMLVDIPEELKQAFLENIEARSIFGILPVSHQRHYARWIADAKKAETRIARARRCLTMLVETVI